MRKYRYVEHTADVEFVAYGADMGGLFRNALLAMFDTAADIRRLSRQRTRAVRFSLEESSDDPKELLWDSLQDALSKASAKGLFAYRVQSLSVRKTRRGVALKAVVLGRKGSPECAKLDVKGVSKYDMGVKKAGRHYEASIVLDV
jgi:SHS2 domain-containing protein